MALQALASTISPDRWDERTTPDRFTLREAAGHLAVHEPIFRGRMERTVAEPGFAINYIPVSAEEEGNPYGSMNPTEQLAIYLEERAKTVRFIEGCQEEDLKQTAMHPKWGGMTILDQATFLLGHDLYHLRHLTEYFA